MTDTLVIPEPQHDERVLFPGVISTPTDLRIERDLGFNDCRRLLDSVRGIEDRSQWAIGAVWAYTRDKFGADYAEALEELGRSDRTLYDYELVYRAFPPAARSTLLYWRHHKEIVMRVRDADERLRWLSQAERGRWSTRELVERLDQGKSSGPRPPALSLRAVGDVADAINRRAATLNVTPRDLALEVLELAAELDDPVAVLRAAGARPELEPATV